MSISFLDYDDDSFINFTVAATALILPPIIGGGVARAYAARRRRELEKRQFVELFRRRLEARR